MSRRFAVTLAAAVLWGCPSEPPPGVEDGPVWRDADGDGWHDGEDCAPEDSAVHPEAVEACDRLDTDCDGEVPAAEVDSDSDRYTPCEGDCDDSTAAIGPRAPEVCNGIDDDCDGELLSRESTGPGADVDDDGDGRSECHGDCDDTDAGVSPWADEVCDGVDTNCDGDLPENDDDGDGVSECDGDCDDALAHIFPGAPEAADRRDDDCNGIVDDCAWSGPGLPGGAVELSEAYAVFAGSENDEEYGFHVTSPGDVDGDGYDDLLIGSRDFAVDLFFGPFCPGTYDRSLADVRFDVVSPYPGDWDWRFGDVGDLDGNGLDDVRIGPDIFLAPLGRSPAERAESFGQRRVASPDLSLPYGQLLMSPGDLNGDGAADLVLGRPLAFHPSVPVSPNPADYGPGVVSVFFGPFAAGAPGSTRTLYPEDADAELVGETWDTFAGSALAGPGDVNGDGKDDLVVGANRDEELVDWGGGVYLLLDVSAGVTSLSAASKKWSGDLRNARVGSHLEFLGQETLLVTSDGEAYILELGAEPGALGARATVLARSAGSDLMTRPAAVGDTSGGGSMDYLVGGWEAVHLVREGSGDEGEVHVDQLPSTVTIDEHYLDGLGAAGDVNRDGFADWLIGDWRSGGRAYLFLGYPMPDVQP